MLTPNTIKKADTWIVSYYINGEPTSIEFKSQEQAQLKYTELLAHNIMPTIHKVIKH